MANTFSSCLKNENVSNTYYQNFVSTLTPSLIYDYLGHRRTDSNVRLIHIMH